MSAVSTDKPSAPRPIGLIAEFACPEALLYAGNETREAGYRDLEAFTPFPVHGLDRAIGVRSTRLAWVVFGAGLTGAVGAFGLQWFTNAFHYPFLISGKPLFSLPANIPVVFEVIILLSALTAFVGVFLINRLPYFGNPLLASERFARASSDRFFLLVKASDPRFSATETADWLRSMGAVYVELCQPLESRPLPRWLYGVAAILAAVALVPPLLVARARATTSASPKFIMFTEMSFQPKFKPQTTSTKFDDRRAMRLPVAGTVARGEFQEDERLTRGIAPGEAPPGPAAAPATPAPAAGPDMPAAAPDPNWTREIPLPVTAELMQRGRLRFNIYCATCHGRAGDGDGIVSQRAQRLQQQTWLPPTSLHAEPVRQQPVGKVFHTISSGVRKMPGYAAQISVEERWAIVLYVRALQRSQAASIDDVPADVRQTLRETK